MENHQKKDREKIKNDIRKAAMEIIGKDGFAGITARKIGKFMGLKNVSLINYYFNSKENLIVETLKNNYFDVMSEVHNSMDHVENPRDKLIALFDKMLEIFWNYPALIGLFYFDEIRKKGFIKEDYIQELVILQNNIVLKNLSVLRQVLKNGMENEVYLKLFQLRGAIMYLALAKETIIDFQDYFKNPVNRKEYVRSIVNGIYSGLDNGKDI